MTAFDIAVPMLALSVAAIGILLLRHEARALVKAPAQRRDKHR